MADFCQQCSIEVWGGDTRDLADLMPVGQYEGGYGALALCEGCGPTVVDIEGACIAQDCTQHSTT